MNASHCSTIFASLIVLCLHFNCEARTYGDDGVAAKLEIAGAECETDKEGNIVGVYFRDELATAQDLSLFAELEHVTEIAISGVDLGDDGLKHLSSLATLKELDASETKCTDRDLENLASLTAIEWIDLSDTAITDASIDTLMKLPNLKWIDLSSTRVTVDGLGRLRKHNPELHVSEWWNYRAGVMGGRGLLDIQRATIIFDYVRASGSGGGWGGGSIEVSKPIDNDQSSASMSGGGGSIGPGSVSAALAYVDGIPTIRVGKHTVEIRNDGSDLFVDGQRFRITKKKLRISLTADGVATLLD
ncbi:hypothetical protein [Allorhodopirellula heiligendammensis]|uniref:hypothetical protein n=1 Tax=Allorhodopirellula heiligendammensis TaxID=2714739 RepID=UPI0011B64B12|nr:hypothetical protein [Allorhodopirellula heiligendammensis]